jgi:presequence protease
MTKKNTPAQSGITTSSLLHGFTVEKIRTIEEIHSTAYLFTHAKTGARLLHIYNDDPNNLFSVAFRTPVYDNTGVPHIMEHSVLGGSRKFPVKDPFQEMLKGSLQTFLNALTYRDKTVYPVGSQVEKDFFNLVDVYCDSVFHPLLTENTLHQEGWHFDVESLEKSVNIKGIVYNEMKGVFSDFSSHVSRKSMAGLMPDTTYAFESGGEPEHITDLTYDAFVGFHRRYYHPSNSYIVLYGNIPSEKTLRFLNDTCLSDFTAIVPASDIAPQPLWTSPRTLSFEAPAPKEDDGTATVLLLWLFCDSSDPVSLLCGTVLSHYLLGTESSPLKRALIDSGLGEDLDDMSGFGTEAIQSTFCAGLRKTRPEHAEKIREIILGTLKDQVERGMNAELLEGALRQVEFHLREVSGSHFPYSLRLADRCYNSWLYGGDPLAHLAFEKPLSVLKDHREAGDSFFRDVIRKRLLDNRHQLLSTITASSKMGDELQKQTERQAALLSSSFTKENKERYRRITADLIKKQSAPPSAESLATLPRLSLEDLPRREAEVPAAIATMGGVSVYAHPIFTSDIVYLDLCFNLRALPPELIPWLPLYLELLRRCGTKTRTYEQMAVRIALAMGGLGTSVSCKTTTGSADDLFLYSFIHGKSLRSRLPEMLDILQDLLANADLTNKKLIKDLLLEERNDLNASIISSGHSMAMLLASSPLSCSRSIEEKLNGITQLRFLDGLIKSDSPDATVTSLERLHGFMVNKNICTISVTNDEPSALSADLAPFINSLPGTSVSSGSPASARAAGPKGIRGIEISSAVNFMARSWRLGAFDADEYGLIFLLTRNLSTGYLWDKVRVEGGAYGGMSVMSIAHPVFSCASYRDPNLTATLRHFGLALESVAAGIDDPALEQSIIGAIGRIDQPKSPHGRGFGETLDRLSGYTYEARQKLRDAVLGATPEKMRKIARKILETKVTATAVLGSAAAFDAAEKEGLKIEREPLIP